MSHERYRSLVGIRRDAVRSHGQDGVSRQPRERTLDDPALWLHLEAVLALRAAHVFEGKVEIGSLVQQGASIIGRVTEQMLYPCPGLDQGIEHWLSSGRVSNISGRQVHSQKSAIGIKGDVLLRPLNFLYAS